jgi:hypothetical protein
MMSRLLPLTAMLFLAWAPPALPQDPPRIWVLPAPPPDARVRTYRTMSEEQASAQVRDYAATIAAVVGADAKETERGVSRLACANWRGDFARDGRFYIHGVWQMPLPADKHPSTLERLRESWAAQGYIIKGFKMSDDIRGSVVAENPSDEVELSVVSTVPPSAVAVMVMSACYRPPVASSRSTPD